MFLKKSFEKSTSHSVWCQQLQVFALVKKLSSKEDTSKKMDFGEKLSVLLNGTLMDMVMQRVHARITE
jgi:hypothetical protein